MSINFGEEMAYWYLRLNGFFLISNFVLHRDESNAIKHSADADLLAVRMPGTCESIANQELACDESFLKQLSSAYNNKILGLYIEVKTGKAPQLENSFNTDRLNYARKRLGKAFDKLAGEASADQLNGAILTGADYCFGKVLIYDEHRSGRINRADCITLPLSEVDSFLRNRLCPVEKVLIANAKSGDRLFFQSDLLQYLLWSNSPDQ